MSLVVSRNDRGSVVVFEVAGEFRAFSQSFRELQAGVRTALDEGRVDVIFDLGKLQYADSTALGNLVGIHMDIKKKGGRLVLCNLLPHLRAVIQKANLQRYFHILENLSESLDKLAMDSPQVH